MVEKEEKNQVLEEEGKNEVTVEEGMNEAMVVDEENVAEEEGNNVVEDYAKNYLSSDIQSDNFLHYPKPQYFTREIVLLST